MVVVLWGFGTFADSRGEYGGWFWPVIAGHELEWGPRPSGTHLLYLAALVVLLGALALLRHGGVGAAFALVDAMAGSTAALLTARLPPGTGIPRGGAGVEAAVCVLVALAGAAVAVRMVRGRQAGTAGALTQLSLLAGTFFLEGDLWPWPPPGDPRWEPVHQGWSAALPLLALVLILAHRDPVTPPPRRTTSS
ncbi:hypothetical protein [Sphaerisporangium dianthi]|uniref:DUF998 domain-containing protein n=1 Tax=Sphaerisporangium dianthi TaxID=1436120 RepID=A0ABV9CBT0_9ACTN